VLVIAGRPQPAVHAVGGDNRQPPSGLFIITSSPGDVLIDFHGVDGDDSSHKTPNPNKLTKPHNHFTALFRDHPGEPVPEENFWTLWCKGRLTDTPTIRQGATPSGLTSAHLHHPAPHFLQAGCPSCHPTNSVKDGRQSTEGNKLTQTKPKPPVSFKNCSRVCVYHCALLSHTTQNSSDNLRYYPPDNHHCSDAVYWRAEAGPHYG